MEENPAESTGELTAPEAMRPKPRPLRGVEAGPVHGLHRPSDGGRVGELSGAGSGDPRPGLSG